MKPTDEKGTPTMTNNTHWRVAPPSGRSTGLDILCGNVRIAAVSGANAKHAKHAAVIAAAPELLAALRAALPVLETHALDGGRAARAAIAKAEAA